MKYILTGFFTFLFCLGFAWAQVPPEVTPFAFLTEVMNAIKAFGGLDSMGKAALIITVLLSSLKVSLLRQYLWDKMGEFKVWAPIILGLAVGLLQQGSSLNLASAFVYISVGAGAVLFHELLDTVKAIPGIGPVWVAVIDFIKSALGGKSQPVVSLAATKEDHKVE